MRAQSGFSAKVVLQNLRSVSVPSRVLHCVLPLAAASSTRLRPEPRSGRARSHAILRSGVPSRASQPPTRLAHLPRARVHSIASQAHRGWHSSTLDTSRKVAKTPVHRHLIPNCTCATAATTMAQQPQRQYRCRCLHCVDNCETHTQYHNNSTTSESSSHLNNNTDHRRRMPKDERTNHPTNQRTTTTNDERTNQPTNERTNQPTNQPTNPRRTTNGKVRRQRNDAPTNERTNQPTHARTNEPTNQRTNDNNERQQRTTKEHRKTTATDNDKRRTTTTNERRTTTTNQRTNER